MNKTEKMHETVNISSSEDSVNLSPTQNEESKSAGITESHLRTKQRLRKESEELIEGMPLWEIIARLSGGSVYIPCEVAPGLFKNELEARFYVGEKEFNTTVQNSRVVMEEEDRYSKDALLEAELIEKISEEEARIKVKSNSKDGDQDYELTVPTELISF